MDKRIAFAGVAFAAILLALSCGGLKFERSPLYTRHSPHGETTSSEELVDNSHADSAPKSNNPKPLAENSQGEHRRWNDFESPRVFDVDTSAANRASRFRWREAVEILEKLPERTSKEDYLLAFAKSQLGDHRSARGLFAKLSDDSAWAVYEYIIFDYAVSLAQTDSLERAIALFRRVKSPKLEESALAKIYELHKEKRDWPKTFAAFDELVKKYPKRYTNSGVRLIRAGLHLSAGDTARAVELYGSVVKDGTSANILAAARALDRIGKLLGQNLYLAGRTAADSRNWASADDWLGRYIASGVKANVGEAYYYRARALSRRGRHNEAITIYRKIISEKLYNRAWAELGIAYCMRKLDRFVEAEKHLDTAISLGAGTNAEAEALWEGVNLGRDQKNYTLVADYSTRLSTKFPRHTYGDNGAMWSGLSNFMRGEFTTAGDRFARIPEIYSDKTFTETGTFWRGLSLVAGGDDAGRGTIEEVSRSSTRHYYKYYATEILTDVALPDPLHARSRKWMTYREAIDLAGEAFSELGHREAMLSVSSGAGLRASIFAEMGLVERARTELDTWMDETSMTPSLRLAFLAVAYEWGLTGSAYNIALALVRDMGGYASAPTEVIRLAYPTFYADLIFECAEREGIDPAIMFAVARRESMFDPHIVSPAGAIGLLQIMPQTGANLSRLFGEFAEFSDAILYDFNTSARYGTRYLA
ncbi:MAG TPA: tetratricopeptide repeat protein, partial [candidate division Zixibacteria bacterium]|nr:tetratricopeptide repeat protein [candidate division Zixibacteria bacterium]